MFFKSIRIDKHKSRVDADTITKLLFGQEYIKKVLRENNYIYGFSSEDKNFVIQCDDTVVYFDIFIQSEDVGLLEKIAETIKISNPVYNEAPTEDVFSIFRELQNEINLIKNVVIMLMITFILIMFFVFL